MPTVAVLPKMQRCLSRYSRVATLPKASPGLACWNWALTGLDDHAIPIDTLYNYVNGLAQIGDVDAAGYPNLTAALRGDLIALEALWAVDRNGVYGNGKKALIVTYSKQMATLVTKIYGLPVSTSSTGVEICMHFEAALSQGARESNAVFAERQSALGIGFEHWWIRFKEKTIVETFPSIAVLQLAQSEQAHRHLTIWRAHVSALQPEHLTHLTTFIRNIKGTNPFVHAAGRQPWVADATRTTCSWCRVTFGTLTRKHHCRSCGKIFCANCAFKTEMVLLPSAETGAPAAATVRVCDTCYTGND